MKYSFQQYWSIFTQYSILLIRCSRSVDNPVVKRSLFQISCHGGLPFHIFFPSSQIWSLTLLAFFQSLGCQSFAVSSHDSTIWYISCNVLSACSIFSNTSSRSAALTSLMLHISTSSLYRFRIRSRRLRSASGVVCAKCSRRRASLFLICCSTCSASRRCRYRNWRASSSLLSIALVVAIAYLESCFNSGEVRTVPALATVPLSADFLGLSAHWEEKPQRAVPWAFCSFQVVSFRACRWCLDGAGRLDWTSKFLILDWVSALCEISSSFILQSLSGTEDGKTMGTKKFELRGSVGVTAWLREILTEGRSWCEPSRSGSQICCQAPALSPCILLLIDWQDRKQ